MYLQRLVFSIVFEGVIQFLDRIKLHQSPTICLVPTLAVGGIEKPTPVLGPRNHQGLPNKGCTKPW